MVDPEAIRFNAQRDEQNTLVSCVVHQHLGLRKVPFAVQRPVGGTLPFETVVLDFQRFIGAGCQVREVIGINEMDEIVLHDGMVGEHL